MAVNLHCDKCGRFLKPISPQELSKMRHDEQVVCDECLEAIKVWSDKVAVVCSKGVKELNQTLTDAKNQLRKLEEDRLIQTTRVK